MSGAHETLAAALTAASPTPSDSQRLAALLKQVEHGQEVSRPELVALAQSADRATRGLAKRLLAHVMVKQVRADAAELLAQACADLDYRYPVVLGEALEQARGLGQTARLYELWVAAGEQAVARGEFLVGLQRLQNAAALDFREGARHVGDPECLRRLMAIYARAAEGTAAALGIQAAPRHVRRSPRGARLRLAHVIGQLVDGMHSPSRVMRAVLRNADRAGFDVSLFVTEALAQHAQHAEQAYHSDWSDRRAPRLIAYLERELKIPVVRPTNRQSMLGAMAELHREMAARQIDIAYFHGSIATPADWLLCAWRAAPWQVDHGMGLPLHCPGVDMQFFEYPETMERLAFWCRERGVAYATTDFGGTDMSHLEELEPFPRAQLKISAEQVVLGTIGNHLPRRMSAAFCRTVGAVLRAHPRVTYVVVGPGDFGGQAAQIGMDLCAGAQPRVLFVGPTGEPGRFTKMFDIYVNEYPGGGGVAVCEAMAARKPVVAMVVDATALAAVAQKYLSDEHLVQPATDEAYARRLAELIVQPAARRALGEKLRARYESDFDGRKWAAEMERRILMLVEETR